MESLTEILKGLSTGEISLTVALIGVCAFLVAFFYKEIKKLYNQHNEEIKVERHEHLKRYDEIYSKYKDDHNKIVKQMFEAMNKNTEANTKLAEAVRTLSDKIKE
jgi:predicted RND superfamily exporter protein